MAHIFKRNDVDSGLHKSNRIRADHNSIIAMESLSAGRVRTTVTGEHEINIAYHTYKIALHW